MNFKLGNSVHDQWTSDKFEYGENWIEDGHLAAILEIWQGASDFLVDTLESTNFIRLTPNLDIVCMTYKPQTS